MKVFSIKLKILIFPIYYLIHNNLVFGLIHKYIIRVFNYKNLRFELQNIKLPLGYYSSFLWKTYELNDRIIIEKNLTKKNKCIIIGGGIGFIATLTYHLTKNKILVFEINKEIINNLKKNLKINKSKFKIYNSNLSLIKNYSKKYYFDTNNFLTNSIFRNTKKKIKFNNLFYKKIEKFENFNTLIIDGEGIEKHYVENINKLKNIKYLIFEFHSDILNENKKNELFNILSKQKFYLKDKFINSFYFVKIN